MIQLGKSIIKPRKTKKVVNEERTQDFNALYPYLGTKDRENSIYRLAK